MAGRPFSGTLVLSHCTETWPIPAFGSRPSTSSRY
jgi:hypothetical protein